MMSLHVGKQPVGLIFGDRSLGVNKLDKACYLRFKSAVLLTSKALTWLSQHKKQARAQASG